MQDYTFGCNVGDPVTFSASYSHDGLEADLPGEVALQISLELL